MWWGVIRTVFFQKGVCHPLHTHLEIFQLKKNVFFQENKAMENLSAVTYASTGTCGCGQVRAKRLKRAFSYVFFLSQMLLVKFLRGEVQNHGILQL